MRYVFLKKNHHHQNIISRPNLLILSEQNIYLGLSRKVAYCVKQTKFNLLLGSHNSCMNNAAAWLLSKLKI